MLRQRTGSTVCPGCGSLVGVNDDTCYNCGRRNPGLWGFAPLLRRLGQDLGFGTFVIVASVGLYLATLVASDNPSAAARASSRFCLPIRRPSFCLAPAAPFPVFELGWWWTVLSAGWLHGGLLHILFNMNALRQLAPPVAELYGAGRMMIVYTAGGVMGFTASSVMGYVAPGHTAAGRIATDHWCVGADLRPAGCDCLLRPSQRQFRHEGDGVAERRDHVRDGVVPARHRQLGARRRVWWRMADVEVARPAHARAGRSPHRGPGVCRGDGDWPCWRRSCSACSSSTAAADLHAR